MQLVGGQPLQAAHTHNLQGAWPRQPPAGTAHNSNRGVLAGCRKGKQRRPGPTEMLLCWKDAAAAATPALVMLGLMNRAAMSC